MSSGLCQPTSLAEAVVNTCRLDAGFDVFFNLNLDAISDVKDAVMGRSHPHPPSVAAPRGDEGAVKGLCHP